MTQIRVNPMPFEVLPLISFIKILLFINKHKYPPVYQISYLKILDKKFGKQLDICVILSNFCSGGTFVFGFFNKFGFWNRVMLLHSITTEVVIMNWLIATVYLSAP